MFGAMVFFVLAFSLIGFLLFHVFSRAFRVRSVLQLGVLLAVLTICLLFLRSYTSHMLIYLPTIINFTILIPAGGLVYIIKVWLSGKTAKHVSARKVAGGLAQDPGLFKAVKVPLIAVILGALIWMLAVFFIMEINSRNIMVGYGYEYPEHELSISNKRILKNHMAVIEERIEYLEKNPSEMQPNEIELLEEILFKIKSELESRR